MIREFLGVAAEHVAGSSAARAPPGINLILGRQELADLKSAGEALREQALGNVATVVAHRQNAPASAELIRLAAVITGGTEAACDREDFHPSGADRAEKMFLHRLASIVRSFISKLR
jgi:hypothetical protein